MHEKFIIGRLCKKASMMDLDSDRSLSSPKLNP